MKDTLYRMENTQEQEKDSIITPTNDTTVTAPTYPLQNKWTLWYYENNKSRSWQDNLHEVYVFDTVEQFWCLFNHIKSVQEIGMGNDYSLFKMGIRPEWEDDRNKNGGRWLLNVDSKFRYDLNETWLDLLLFMIGESFDDYSDEICGAFVNIRKIHRIALWTANSNKEKEIIGIGEKLKGECLGLPKEVKISYEAHVDSQNRGGNSRIKSLYTL